MGSRHKFNISKVQLILFDSNALLENLLRDLPFTTTHCWRTLSFLSLWPNFHVRFTRYLSHTSYKS